MESTSPKKADHEYESKLAEARQAQAKVDRAIEELRQVQRFLADAPTIIASRRRAAEQAQQSLAEAENKLEGAKEIMSAKQMEVALLMEKAASHQQALARSLAPGQHFPELDQPTAATPLAKERAPKRRDKAAKAGAQQSDGELTAPAWPTTYTFPTPNAAPVEPKSTQKEHGHGVVKFLHERDLPCPSCDFPLRGLQSNKCPKCGMSLSLSVLKANMPPKSTKRIWAIRGVAAIALLMSLYLTFVGFTGKELIACGVGSSCEDVFTSGYAKIKRIPVAVLGVMVFGLIGLASFFVGTGQRDSTRRRGWTALTILAMLAGGGGLWFIFVQVVMLKGICPHCMLIDVCGLVLAFMILRKAPLMRDEVLGHSPQVVLNFSKRRTLTLAGISLLCLLGFIGAHTMLKGTQLHRVGGTSGRTGDSQGAGLMMKGLSSDKIDKEPSQPDGTTPSPSTNDSAKSEPIKSDVIDKKDDKKDDEKPSGGGLFFKPSP